MMITLSFRRSNMLVKGLALALKNDGFGWDTCRFTGAPGGAGNGTLPGAYFCLLKGFILGPWFDFSKLHFHFSLA
jgi:hypothetical protein